ncbi:MAG: T9SS type A sorting domain-containing protein, partial [Cyclobacteriaceae bacterium]
MPHDPNIIWAGTEIGLFESTDGGQSWHFADNGLPAVSIWQLKVVDDQVVVATHGRGIWSVTINELPEIPVLPSIDALGTGLQGELVIDASLRSSYDSTLVFVNGLQVGKIGASEAADNLINVTGFAPDDSLGVALLSYKDGFLLPSNVASTRLFDVNDIREAYVNDFNEPSDDFIGDNFRIIFKSDFNSEAIHTTHPYDQGNGFPGGRTNYIYQLKTPIIIKDANASLSYRDVAIVETGESGTNFGDTDFYDYVVVEGTKDGINWEPIADGYDSNFDPKWLTAYNAEGTGDESMYVSHRVDLLETFNPGDTVFFRFRLFSDPFTAGWGWIIDDLNIQDQVTGIDDEPEAGAFTLYPNPVFSTATIRVQLPKTETVSWQMIDLSGKIVDRRNFGLQPKGLRTYELPTDGLRPGIYIVNLQRGGDLFKRKLVVSG